MSGDAEEAAISLVMRSVASKYMTVYQAELKEAREERRIDRADRLKYLSEENAVVSRRLSWEMSQAIRADNDAKLERLMKLVPPEHYAF